MRLLIKNYKSKTFKNNNIIINYIIYLPSSFTSGILYVDNRVIKNPAYLGGVYLWTLRDLNPWPLPCHGSALAN